MSDDLAEIKQRLASVEDKEPAAKTSTGDILSSLKDQIEAQAKLMSHSSGSIDIAKFDKDLQEIKLRLSAIHKIISNMTEK